MSNLLIDAYCLISFVIDRNPEQSEAVHQLFIDVAGKNQTIVIISHVITEFVYVLEKIYLTKSEVIADMVKDLLKMPQIEYREGYFPEEIFELWPYKIKDYGDAALAAASHNFKIPVYTFDKKFYNQLKSLQCKVVLM